MIYYLHARGVVLVGGKLYMEMQRSERRVEPIAVVDHIYIEDGNRRGQDVLLGSDGRLYGFDDVLHLADPYCDDKNNHWLPWRSGANKRMNLNGRTVDDILNSSVVKFKDSEAYDFACSELDLKLGLGEVIGDETGKGRVVIRYREREEEEKKPFNNPFVVLKEEKA